MAYRQDCDLTKKPTPVGNPICVYGNDSHTIFVCMPGNAKSRIRVTAIVAYYPVEDFSVAKGCTSTLKAPAAFNPGTISYRDITGNGTYNKYLSCTTGCTDTEITPGADAPDFVDYEICGTASGSLCSSKAYCDIVRVYFKPEIKVAIDPTPAIFCPGSSGVLLKGIVTNGNPATDKYIWTNSLNIVVGNAINYTATTTGKYNLEVRNENYPKCVLFSASVDVYDNLSVNAGADQTVCPSDKVQLDGKVTAATGGIWSGGLGTYSPNNLTLNALYTPTANEIQAGSVTLTLTTTGNGNCAALKDDVKISFHKPLVINITAPPILCNNATGTITATPSAGSGSYSFKWNSGETTQSIIKPAGTYTVTVTDITTKCTGSQSVTIKNEIGPTQVAATATASTCGNSNGIIIVNAITGGTGPFTYSINGTTFQSATTFNGLAAKTYTLSAKDANTCTITTSVLVSNIAGPTALSASTSSATCGNSNGSITVTNVTGGTSAYTYSINGTSFQASSTFSGLEAKTYTVTAKDANNCIISASATVTNIPGPTEFLMTSQPASCKNNDGSITIGSVTGGTAAYTYSADGINFSSSATISNLASGNYTIRVKDANNCVITKPTTVGATFPTKVNAIASPSTCGFNNGKIDVLSVEGGQAAYSYSLDGIAFQSSPTFTGLSAGNYTLTAKDKNDCKISEFVVLSNIPGPSAVTAATTSSTCGNNNGRITVSGVTGGTNPYTYSINGNIFQSSTTFSGLAATGYTLTARDANNCTVTTSVTILNISGPSNFATTATASTCGSSNGSLLVSGITGGTGPYTYSIDGGTFQISNNFMGLFAKSYSISVKDANNCLIAKAISVSDISGPGDFQATTKPATCGASDGEINVTSVTGGTASYTYSIDGLIFQPASLFTQLPAAIHTIFIKDANGCQFQKEITVLNNGGPEGFTRSIKSATCDNSDGAIEIKTVTGGDAPFTYSIDDKTFQGPAIFSNLKAGTYKIRVKDAKNCVFEANVAVPSTGPSALNLSFTPSTCGSPNGKILVNNVTGGINPYTYSLNGLPYQSATEFSGLMAGEHEVTVKDKAGCLFSNKITVGNIPGPAEAAIEVLHPTCDLKNGSLYVTALEAGSPPFSYSIDGGAFQADQKFFNLGDGDYEVTIKDVNNCLISRNVNLKNIPGPSMASAVSKTATCGDSNGQIEVNNITGGTVPFSYSINNLPFQSGNIFNNVAEGNYNVTVKDANSCMVTTKVAVGNIPGPADVLYSSVLPNCGQNDGEIKAGLVSGGTAPYTYSLDGLNYNASLEFTGLYAGLYTLFVKDKNNCILEKTISLNNLDGPSSFTVSTTPATCNNKDGSITILTTEGGSLPYEYALDNGDFQTSTSFFNLSGGKFLLKIKDSKGCTFEGLVYVSSSGPYDADITTSFSSCNINDGTITVNAVFGGIGPYTYSIDKISFQTSNSFIDLGSGKYTLYIKDASACTLQKEFSILNNGPLVVPEVIKQISCYGASDGMLQISAVGGNGLVQFSKDGIIYQDNGLFQNLTPGSYTIFVKDEQDCINVFPAFHIFQPDSLNGNLKVLQMPDKNRSNGIIALSDMEGGSYPYYYVIDNKESNDSIFYNIGPGEHIITMYDANGCFKEFIINTEEYITDFEIPNGFTPNGDGRNDLWEIKNLNLLYPDCEVMVFNRWGSMLFYSKGYSTPWNGSRNGQPVPAATYYYIIKINGKEKPYKGAVSIIR
ncbi:MAG: gliding motility-associated C-terminal domain-containing protein [Bacteroidota bacterium]|nr:gliding motility-associated C-terminal domain-containing protein [Bacteroidota bacterium]